MVPTPPFSEIYAISAVEYEYEYEYEHSFDDRTRGCGILSDLLLHTVLHTAVDIEEYIKNKLLTVLQKQGKVRKDY